MKYIYALMLVVLLLLSACGASKQIDELGTDTIDVKESMNELTDGNLLEPDVVREKTEFGVEPEPEPTPTPTDLNITCYDSDGGIEPDEFGYVEVTTYHPNYTQTTGAEDECGYMVAGAHSTLSEKYCLGDDEIGEEFIECEYGCNDGACNSNEYNIFSKDSIYVHKFENYDTGRKSSSISFMNRIYSMYENLKKYVQLRCVTSEGSSWSTHSYSVKPTNDPILITSQKNSWTRLSIDELNLPLDTLSCFSDVNVEDFSKESEYEPQDFANVDILKLYLLEDVLSGEKFAYLEGKSDQNIFDSTISLSGYNSQGFVSSEFFEFLYILNGIQTKHVSELVALNNSLENATYISLSGSLQSRQEPVYIFDSLFKAYDLNTLSYGKTQNIDGKNYRVLGTTSIEPEFMSDAKDRVINSDLKRLTDQR